MPYMKQQDCSSIMETAINKRTNLCQIELISIRGDRVNYGISRKRAICGSSIMQG
jgi:hypothetical protein